MVINKLISLLKIPIHGIVEFPSYVEILYNNQNIGSIPFYEVSGIRTYDTSDAILNQLRWSIIYVENAEELNEKIAELLNTNVEKTIITIGTFRRLYANDLDSNFLASIECKYDGSSWTVEKE